MFPSVEHAQTVVEEPLEPFAPPDLALIVFGSSLTKMNMAGFLVGAIGPLSSSR
jgi:hypothetical protein